MNLVLGLCTVSEMGEGAQPSVWLPILTLLIYNLIEIAYLFGTSSLTYFDIKI